jgi:two-component system, OmpR family, response regulator CssR
MKHVVCVVEDEKDLNELVKRYLEKENFEVRSYMTYQEALMGVQADDVSLWVLDIMLDQGSGFDLLEAIKMETPDVPVIFMSARDQEFDRIIGLEKGSDDYITKPFSPKELVLRVNNIIKRVYKDRAQTLEIDSYVVDEMQRKVFQDDQEIDLTTKEFDLLMLFIRNKGTAFSRTQILDRVWELNYYGSDRVVDDTMRRLRKKLPDFKVSTIYGFGYRWG